MKQASSHISDRMPSLNNQLKQEVELYQTAIDDLQAIFDNSYDVLYVADGKGKRCVSVRLARYYGVKNLRT